MYRNVLGISFYESTILSLNRQSSIKTKMQYFRFPHDVQYYSFSYEL